MLKTGRLAHRDTYLELVRRFPLRRLKSRLQHGGAVEMVTRTSLAHQGTKDAGILDYLDILAELIDQFEKAARLKVDLTEMTAAEVVGHLVEANGLTVSGLAREIGMGQSNLSEMLSGRRDLGKAAIGKLCGRFGICAEVFFGARRGR
jgi:antitoxin component HigA of HigAB toxin-antitoxin module